MLAILSSVYLLQNNNNKNMYFLSEVGRCITQAQMATARAPSSSSDSRC